MAEDGLTVLFSAHELNQLLPANAVLVDETITTRSVLIPVLDRLNAAKGTEEYRIGEIYLSAPGGNVAQATATANQILEQLRNGASFAAYASRAASTSAPRLTAARSAERFPHRRITRCSGPPQHNRRGKMNERGRRGGLDQGRHASEQRRFLGKYGVDEFVNRKLDRDYSDGIDVIRQIKARVLGLPEAGLAGVVVAVIPIAAGLDAILDRTEGNR